MNEVPGGTDPRSLSSLSAYLPQHNLIFCPWKWFHGPQTRWTFLLSAGWGVAVQEHPWPFSLHPPGAVLVSLSFQTPVSAATTSAPAPTAASVAAVASQPWDRAMFCFSRFPST